MTNGGFLWVCLLQVFVPAPIGDKTHETAWPAPRVAARYAVDLVAAACASLLVTPVIAAVDRAIVENTANVSTIRASLRASLQMACRTPLQFVRHRAFMWTAGLYGATYAAANAIDTSCEWAATDARLWKFAGCTPVNMALVLQKDVVFSRMFGANRGVAGGVSGIILPFPRASLGLFTVRDAHTVLAAFLLPPVIGAWLHDHGYVSSKPRGELIAQLAAPCVIQAISTPYHILALDLFNRPRVFTRPGTEETRYFPPQPTRWQVIRQKYAVTVAARMGRILPAFGVGGVANRHVRQSLATALQV